MYTFYILALRTTRIDIKLIVSEHARLLLLKMSHRNATKNDALESPARKHLHIRINKLLSLTFLKILF